VPYLEPTEAERAAREALHEEIAAAVTASMTNPWSRQTATYIPDEPKQPQQEAS
jgi:hypothetical protein